MGKKINSQLSVRAKNSLPHFVSSLKKAYALLRNKTVALQVPTQPGEQLPQGAKVHAATQPSNTGKEDDHEIYETLNFCQHCNSSLSKYAVSSVLMPKTYLIELSM